MPQDCEWLWRLKFLTIVFTILWEFSQDGGIRFKISLQHEYIGCCKCKKSPNEREG